MDMAFSHHSSNPLEARTSDSINQAYHRRYNRAKQDLSMSSDELGRWDHKEYQQQVKGVLRDKGVKLESTPKAGPSRLRTRTTMSAAAAASKPAFVDLDADEDMESDDPLSLTATPVAGANGLGTLDPRKEFGGGDLGEEQNEPEEEEDEDEVMPPPLQHVSKRVVEPKEDEAETYEDEMQAEEEERQNQGLDYMDQDEEMADPAEEDLVEPEEDDDLDLRPTRSRSRSSSLSSLSSLTRSSTRSRSHSRTPLSSPVSSRPSSPDEFHTLSKRPPEEQEEIVDEIEALYKSVPDLVGQYDVIDRLGTGTFSSVYKAVDLLYDDWENAPWQGHHPQDSTAHYQSVGGRYKGRGGRAEGWRRESVSSSAGRSHSVRMRERDSFREDEGRVYVAIKRIYTTSGPERIRNELSILEDARSCRHVSQIITAFRHEDQVVIVLPYQRNMDFREFYQDLHPEGIKCYFRCLFRALRDIHARGIIHRDVKPANFLYNPFTGIGTLCDFGLASRMDKPPSQGNCLHTPYTPSDPHGKIVTYTEADVKWMKQEQKAARAKSAMSADKVGYPEQDRRPVNKANRAGTRGFRAPEVLLKCTAQTGAIDVWAAGVILLFFLTGKFPIFQSNDDIEGLMEITAIIGKKNMEKVATLHARTMATNVPDVNHEGITWEEFVQRLNPDLMKPRKYDMRYYPHNSKHKDGRGSSSSSELAASAPAPHLDDRTSRHANPLSVERHKKEMTTALAFLSTLLQVESTKRATPRKALSHRFLEEPGMPGDDEYIPHRPGEGICKALHRVETQGRDDADRPSHVGGGARKVHYVRVVRKCVCAKNRKEVLSREVLSPIGKEGSDGYEDEDEVVVDLDDSGDEGEYVSQNGERSGETVGGDGGAQKAQRWCGEWVEDVKECSAGEGVAIGREPCEFHQGLEELGLWDQEMWAGEGERRFI